MKRAAPSTSIHPLATPCPQRRPRDCRLAGIRPTCRVRRLRDTERDAATELLTATRIPPNEASGSFRELAQLMLIVSHGLLTTRSSPGALISEGETFPLQSLPR